MFVIKNAVTNQETILTCLQKRVRVETRNRETNVLKKNRVL